VGATPIHQHIGRSDPTGGAGSRRKDPQLNSSNPPSLKDVATDYVRDRIVSGEYPPGSKVPQDEVAEALGISRLPVREALIELGEKGFVVTVPRRGVFVVELSPQDIADQFEVLGAVFAIAARRAAGGMDDEQLRRLRQLHKAIGESDQPSERADLNREFNRIVNRAASSPRLQAILQSLAGALPSTYYLASPKWEATEAKYRRSMLKSIRSHDSEAAAAVAVEHMQECARLATDVLRARTVADSTDTATAR